MNKDPSAETKYKTPIHKSVFFLPIESQGIPPNMAPITVPQRAIDMMNVPWNQGVVCHNSLMGKLAPEMTTVSKPNKNPASATVMVQ